MARPISTGITYFSLDVHLDDEFELIESKFGLVGFGIIIKLYQKIYSNSYYIEWTERELLKFKNRINVDLNLINDVINECLKWGLLSKELYDQYGILTSRGIQKRYIEATQRRKEVIFIREYLLIELTPKSYPEKVIVNINSINDCINSEKTDINSQSKVKESKVIDLVTTDPPFPPELNFGDVIKAWESDFGLTVPGTAKDDLKAWHEQDNMPLELLIEAIKEAARSGTRNMKYVSGILRGWHDKGITNIAGVIAAREEWEKTKSKVVHLNGTPRNRGDTNPANRSPQTTKTEYPAGGIG
jgi:DnaD/phage-associated family protein